MRDDVWESRYFDAFDKVLLNSEIYLAVRDFHVNAMKESRVVLDSGCGTGNVTIGLLKRGHTVYAVDNSKKALDILRKKCAQYAERLNVQCLDAEHLPFKDEMFNGASSMFVVYYVDDFESYLRESYRVLKPNGIFALTGRVSTENKELILKSYGESLRKRGLLKTLEKEWDIFKGKWINSVMTSVKGHSLGQMKSILENIGFTNIQEFTNPYFGQCYSLTAKK